MWIIERTGLDEPVTLTKTGLPRTNSHVNFTTWVVSLLLVNNTARTIQAANRLFDRTKSKPGVGRRVSSMVCNDLRPCSSVAICGRGRPTVGELVLGLPAGTAFVAEGAPQWLLSHPLRGVFTDRVTDKPPFDPGKEKGLSGLHR